MQSGRSLVPYAKDRGSEAQQYSRRPWLGRQRDGDRRQRRPRHWRGRLLRHGVALCGPVVRDVLALPHVLADAPGRRPVPGRRDPGRNLRRARAGVGGHRDGRLVRDEPRVERRRRPSGVVVLRHHAWLGVRHHRGRRHPGCPVLLARELQPARLSGHRFVAVRNLRAREQPRRSCPGAGLGRRLLRQRVHRNLELGRLFLPRFRRCFVGDLFRLPGLNRCPTGIRRRGMAPAISAATYLPG